jgi:predicted patatin/cPLA2 family phospholipase
LPGKRVVGWDLVVGHPVLEVVLERSRSGSEPGRRRDGRHVVLAVEGGGSRGTFSSGMVLALHELGLLNSFDAVYGSSAGAISGGWFVSGGAAHGIPGWWQPGVMRRITNLPRALRGRPVVDIEYTINTIYQSIVPMDWAAVLASPVPLHPLATDVVTGESVDLRPFITDDATLRLALRATACLPLLSGPPVELAGRRFVDGGLAEPLAFRTAMRAGATDILVLRTRRADEPVTAPSRLENALITRYLSRSAPGALAAWQARRAQRLADEELLAAHTGAGGGRPALCQLRPPVGAPSVSRLETDPQALRRAVMIGRDAMLTALRPVPERRPAPGATRGR